MSFIRPEARDAIWRWREVLTGLAVALVGLSWVLGPRGLLGLVGWVAIAIGIVLIVSGAQRARFRKTEDGPGVVTVDEGQIAYFGPLTGGAVALGDIERLTLDPTARPPHWVLSQKEQPALNIPVNAAGSEALFDAFSALPGIRTERMLSHLQGKTLHPVVIWERVPLRPVNQRLH